MRYLLIPILFSLLIDSVWAKIPKEQDVINSVLRFYPKIIEEEENLKVQRGDYLSKKGLFDAKITGGRIAYEDGVYDERYYDEIGITKPLPFANTKIFTSYSKSSDIPYPLDNDSDNTLSDGRAKIGFSMSLLRGFLTNEDLTKLKVSDIGVDIAKENFKLTKLTVINKAKKAYYNYVAAKSFYDIALDIVNLRKERLDQVTIQSKAGDKPTIYVVDSKRSLLKSKSDLINAKQNLQSASFLLSIYYRDHDGNKIVIDEENKDSFNLLTLENNAQLPQEATINDEIQSVKQQRADIKIIDLKIRQEKQYLKLHKNQFLPELDFKFTASKDFGDDIASPSSTDIKRDERLNFGINLSIPLQVNKQKGLTGKTKAKINSLKMKKRLIQDSIEIDIKSVYNQILNLNNIYHNLKQEVQMSQTLLDAEKIRFKNGDSDIITINIREQSLFAARQKMLKSLKKILNLLADYNLLLMRN